MNEAKKLKHKADMEVSFFFRHACFTHAACNHSCLFPSQKSNKFLKAFNYMDAAMYFVESAAAMEKKSQMSKASHAILGQTVELLKYEPSTPQVAFNTF